MGERLQTLELRDEVRCIMSLETGFVFFTLGVLRGGQMTTLVIFCFVETVSYSPASGLVALSSDDKSCGLGAWQKGQDERQPGSHGVAVVTVASSHDFDLVLSLRTTKRYASGALPPASVCRYSNTTPFATAWPCRTT